jgi:hypothetical protein
VRSVLLFAAALAISLPKSSIAGPYADYPTKETRQIAYDYAKCVVSRHAGDASAAVLSDTDNRTLFKSYGALVDGDCLVRIMHVSAQMKFPADLYRYALADALFARELAAVPVIDPSDMPPLSRRPPPDALPPLATNSSKRDRSKYEDAVKGLDELKTFRALGELGECVVRTNPAAAKSLLLTKPETAAEANGFDTLRAALAECIPPGMKLTLGKLVLRGTIAVNYYRLAHSVRPVR